MLKDSLPGKTINRDPRDIILDRMRRQIRERQQSKSFTAQNETLKISKSLFVQPRDQLYTSSFHSFFPA